MWIFFERYVAWELLHSWKHHNFGRNALYHNSCLGGLGHFRPYLEHLQNCYSIFGHFFMPMPFFLFRLFSDIGITIRMKRMFASASWCQSASLKSNI